jgi:peptidoglycan/LPS O-acetylase OafA/YrhL
VLYSFVCVVTAIEIGILIHLLVEKPILRFLRRRLLPPRELLRKIG